MKNIRKILRIIGALLLTSPAFGQAVGGNGVVQGTVPSGSTAAGNPVQVGGVDGTVKVRPFKTDTSGQLFVNAVQSGSWLGGILGVNGTSIATSGNPFPVSVQGSLPAGSNAIGSVTVSNFPGTQPVSGTVAATQSGTWNVGITGAVAATQSGTWSTGRTWTLGSGTDSVTTVPSGTQTVSGTVTANIGTTNGVALDATLTGGNQKTQVVNGSNALGVDANGNASVKGTVQEFSGSGSSVTTIIGPQSVQGYPTVSLQLTGTWSAQVQLQLSNNGSTYVTQTTLQVGQSSSTTGFGNSLNLTTNGIYTFSTGGAHWFQVIISAYTSGTVNATADISTIPVVPTAITAGVNAAQQGTWTVQPGNTPNTAPWLVTNTPATSGGNTGQKVLSVASTNATSVKASAGQVYSYQFSNAAGAFRYVHFYNKASAPTVGTDVPVFTIGIPTGGTVAWHDVNGTPFSTGIAYSITTGASDTDNTAVSANDVMGLVTYKFCLPVRQYKTVHGRKVALFAA